VQELPVDTPNADTGGNNVIPPAINYVQVLANGTVVVAKTTAMNFAGTGLTVTGSNGTATITVLGSSYGNSNVVTLLSSFGSNTVSTTGNVSAGYVFGNGSQLTGIPVSYGNTNVVANLAALGSNPVSTTGNVTASYVFGNGSQLTGLPATYGNANVVANLAALGSNPVSTTGNVTASYVFGNGSQLSGLPATYGNANVVANLAALGSNPISSTGNITTTANVSGNYILGNGSQLTGIAASYGNANVATFLAAYGSNTISTSGNITAGNLIGNISITGNVQGTTTNVTLVAGSYSTVFDNTGNLTLPGNTFAVNYANNTPVNAVTRVENSWTVPTGNSTQSFTVNSGTYSMWVDCNITNGILVWNATATVTNTNVPVVGAQYAWVYNGGGTPIDFTSIPNQFVGTANTIVRSNTAPSATTNRFDFGINNTSGNAVTVNYGWIQIS
jgi:hypothetical protein